MKCCFTGPRPQKLAWGYDENCKDCLDFKSRFQNCIEKQIADGCDYFISGMAMGVDLIAAEIVVQLKKKYDIKLEAAIPCENQCRGWSESFVKRYYNVLQNCDKIVLVSKKYSFDCMMRRNKYMVDNADVVIAVYKEGREGGTKNTFEYACKKNKKIFVVEEKKIR